MKKKEKVFALCLTLALGVAKPGSARAEGFSLECKVYRVVGNFEGDVSLTDPIWSGIGDAQAEADPAEWIRRLNEDRSVSVFNTADLSDVGGYRLIADATGWSWNGAPEPRPSQGFPKVEAVAAPRVTSGFGQSFTISMNPSEPVEYFERQSDGSYRVRAGEVETGVSIGTESVERGPEGRAILRDFEVSVSTVAEREPLEGTGLDVGKPIAVNRTFKKTFSVEIGLRYGLRIPFESYGTLLLRLQVDLD